MKDWQVDLIIERDLLENRIMLDKEPIALHDICVYAERLYHRTKLIQSLDKEIASWEEKP